MSSFNRRPANSIVMDPGLCELSVILSGGIRFDDVLPDHNLSNGIKLQDPLRLPDHNLSNGFKLQDPLRLPDHNLSNGFKLQDPLRLPDHYLSKGFKLQDPLHLPDHNLCNGFKLQDPLPLPLIDQNIANPPFAPVDPNPLHYLPFVPPDPPQPNHNPISYVSPEEDSEIFSDIALKYISQMLLEEDAEEKSGTCQESVALRATEKPFYDILGEKYPPSPDEHPCRVDDHHTESADDYTNCSNSNRNTGSSNSNISGSWLCNVGSDCSTSQSVLSVSTDYTRQSSLTVCTDYTSQSSFSSSNGVCNVVDGLEKSLSNLISISDFVGESRPIWQYRRVDQVGKLVLNGGNLIMNQESNGFLRQEPKDEANELKDEANELKVKAEEKNERGSIVNASRGRKNMHRVDLDLEEGRSNKQSAVFSDESVRSEMFDMVLLCGGKSGPLYTLQESLQNAVSKSSQTGQQKGSSGGGKSRGKKQGKKEVVDLRTLLVHCAQAIAVDDRRNSTELLKQIRQHSSPNGDGSQRLAHWFADGLEARLAGTGSQVYTALCAKSPKAVDILKAYHLYLAACPFKKISHFFTNQTILNVAANAKRLHIVHFGIYFGFQWPSFLQRLSKRAGGPPRLRITGIDLPQPGFRPAERIEETGRRLEDYARSFNVPFKYTPIACKWENIQVEDLKLDKDEVLVVYCLFRFKGLLDETVVVDSPRNIVLNTTRKMNPDVFIHGIVNGAYSAPFFVTRFREALFHWSALFDMLEANVPRHHPERTILERELFGQEAVNVIACEGLERVERPETYKQWQVRNLRAGFKQLPLDKEIMKKARDKVKNSYHKDFVVDEDSQWMLQGWKGRTLYALSTWKPDLVRL